MLLYAYDYFATIVFDGLGLTQSRNDSGLFSVLKILLVGFLELQKAALILSIPWYLKPFSFTRLVF